MKTIKFLSFLLISLFFLSLIACNSSNSVTSKRGIQKRKYTEGYHSNLAWRKIRKDSKSTEKDFSKLNIDKSKSVNTLDFLQSLTPSNTHRKFLYTENISKSQEGKNVYLLASKEVVITGQENLKLSNKIEKIVSHKKTKLINSIFLEDSCDNIIFKNGEEVAVKIIEITPDIVKYKKCNNLGGPLISVKKSELLLIRYQNGSKEMFSDIIDESISKSDKEKVKLFSALSIGFSLSSILFTLLFNLLFIGILLLIPAIIFFIIALSYKNKT